MVVVALYMVCGNRRFPWYITDGVVIHSPDLSLTGCGLFPLTGGINVWVCMVVHVNVCPVTDWQPVKGVVRLSPEGSWDMLEHALDPHKYEWIRK